MPIVIGLVEHSLAEEPLGCGKDKIKRSQGQTGKGEEVEEFKRETMIPSLFQT